MFGEMAEITPGNRLALKNIPVGTLVHDIEIAPGQGGRMARSAGAYATLQTNEAGYSLLKLPSGEIRKVRETCLATIGQLGNADWMNVRIGKAGRKQINGLETKCSRKSHEPGRPPAWWWRRP